MPASVPPDGRRVRVLDALGLFALVSVLAFVSLTRHPQLGSLAGITDEYFPLGAKLRVNGTLGVAADEPSALRPPGYPAFIAAVLWAFVDSPARLSLPAFDRQGRAAVQVTQGFLLAATAAAFYLWLAERFARGLAWLAALVFAGNPLSIVLVGLLHYDLLHWFLMVLACWATDSALRREQGGPALLVGAGVLWGLSNLVRPVTQLLPFFLLLALVLVARWKPRKALRATAMVTLGLALALAPWTWRNLRVTGRLVPVADNPWMAVWAQSVRSLSPDSSRYVWFDLYLRDFMPVFTRVTGAPAWDYVLQTRLNTSVEAEFRREALGHLRRQPGVFVGNVAANFWSYNVDASAVLLTAYERVASEEAARPPGPRGPRQEWFIRGDPEALALSPLAWSFLGWHAVVSLLALAGLALGVRARSPLLAVAAAVYFCIGTTHALLALHMLHYYSKLPLLVATAFVSLQSLSPARARVMWLVAGGLAAASVSLTLWMLR